MTLILKNIMSPINVQEQHEVSVGGKIDTWALGVSAFNLMTGAELVDTAFEAEVREKLDEFGKNVDNRAIGTDGKVGTFAQSTGFGAEDDLINLMLHPDPNQRPTIDQILAHPALQYPGVGSQHARDMILGLMNDNPQQVDNAWQNLAPR